MAYIVVIEDNPQTARLAAKLLRLYGHSVDIFDTGEAAMIKIFAAIPDLILLDLGLPDMDGQTVIAVLHQQCDLTATPVIAFTAWAPATAREMAKAYGCDGVITKPIDTRTFVHQIEAFLQPAKSNESSNGSQPVR